jgi:hypothetical protein
MPQAEIADHLVGAGMQRWQYFERDSLGIFGAGLTRQKPLEPRRIFHADTELPLGGTGNKQPPLRPCQRVYMPTRLIDTARPG